MFELLHHCLSPCPLSVWLVFLLNCFSVSSSSSSVVLEGVVWTLCFKALRVRLWLCSVNFPLHWLDVPKACLQSLLHSWDMPPLTHCLVVGGDQVWETVDYTKLHRIKPLWNYSHGYNCILINNQWSLIPGLLAHLSEIFMFPQRGIHDGVSEDCSGSWDVWSQLL